MRVGGAAAHVCLVGEKRKSLEVMTCGPAFPSDFSHLATSSNTPSFFSKQEARSIPEHRAKMKNQEETAALKQQLESVTVAPPAKSSAPPEPTGQVTQASGQGLTVGWNNLPPEMEEHILCSMPLLDLARVSATCRAFHACFSRRMAEQEQARTNMAIRCFGRERIVCIAGLIDRLHRGEPVDSKLKLGCANFCRISADGVLEVEEKPSYMDTWAQRTYEPLLIEVHIFSGLLINIPVPNQCWVRICVARGTGVIIFVTCHRDEDVEGMAFVHALLAWGVSPCFREGHPHVRIQLDSGWRLVPTTLVAQAWPLLALATRHKWHIVPWADQPGLKSR